MPDQKKKTEKVRTEQTEKINVRDLDPKKDAKGGMRVFDGPPRQSPTGTP
jgi:hypothetical protein